MIKVEQRAEFGRELQERLIDGTESRNARIKSMLRLDLQHISDHLRRVARA
jgi:hypothetical protein